MNLLNRILAIGLLVTVSVEAVLISVAVVYFPLLKEVVVGQGQGLMEQLSRAQGFQPGFIAAVLLLMGLLLVLSLGLLYREILPPEPKAVRLSGVSSGQAALSLQSIAEHLAGELQKLPEVTQVHPRVTSRGDTMDVHLEVRLASQTAVAAKAEELCRLTRETAEGALGVKVRQVRAHVHLESPRGGQEGLAAVKPLVPGATAQAGADKESTTAAETPGVPPIRVPEPGPAEPRQHP